MKLEVISDVGRGYYLYYTIPEGEYQMSFLGRLLEALGIDLRKVKSVDFMKLVGKRCRAKIKNETRGGETRASVNYFMPYSDKIEVVKEDGAASVNDESGDDTAEEGGTSDEAMPF